MQKKRWHISNQMPRHVYIKYLKLYNGFKLVPRKKDTFINHTLILFLTHYLSEHGGQPHTCSNLEQTTLEMGQPEPSATKPTR